MPDGDPLLDDLAAAVLDGAAVDWVAAESSADPATRTFVRHLRLVSSIVQVHHDPPLTGNDPPVPVPHQITATSDRWGHLRLLERIGRGAFGEVFRAWDTRLDREVALKLLPADAVARLGDRKHDHPGRAGSSPRSGIRTWSPSTAPSRSAIASASGWSSSAARRSSNCSSRARSSERTEVIGIGVELCRAVSAVHAAGLLHRDIKAHNVTRAEDGRSRADGLRHRQGARRQLFVRSDGHAAVPRAGSFCRETGDGPKRYLQPGCAALSPRHRFVSGTWPNDSRGSPGPRARRADRSPHVRPDLRPALARVIERAMRSSSRNAATRMSMHSREIS